MSLAAYPEPSNDPPAHRWDRVRFDGPSVTEEGGGEPGAFADPREAAADQPARHHLRAVPGRGQPELPDAKVWASTLVRAIVEALKGQRPVAQLSRWIDADIFAALSRRAALGVTVDGRPVQPSPVRVQRVHGCEVRAGVWECAVVLHDGGRTRAAALRLEVLHGRWRATALTIG